MFLWISGAQAQDQHAQLVLDDRYISQARCGNYSGSSITCTASGTIELAKFDSVCESRARVFESQARVPRSVK